LFFAKFLILLIRFASVVFKSLGFLVYVFERVYILLVLHDAHPHPDSTLDRRDHTPITPYGKKIHLRFRGREVYPTEGSCRFPLIVLQQTTQSFLAPHNSVIPARPSIRQGEQEAVLLALVITLLVVMGHVLLQGSTQ
jgi:hypothetical protein